AADPEGGHVPVDLARPEELLAGVSARRGFALAVAEGVRRGVSELLPGRTPGKHREGREGDRRARRRERIRIHDRRRPRTARDLPARRVALRRRDLRVARTGLDRELEGLAAHPPVDEEAACEVTAGAGAIAPRRGAAHPSLHEEAQIRARLELGRLLALPEQPRPARA